MDTLFLNGHSLVIGGNDNRTDQISISCRQGGPSNCLCEGIVIHYSDTLCEIAMIE